MIKQPPAEADQSGEISGANNQSETQIQEVTSSEQSGASLQHSDEMQNVQSNIAS